MEYLVLGTAGHIDHGKTSLVKALTGTDTDRLKEEKERGITIDLGFAYMPLPSGVTLSIIDVPGHEKFVRNMVSGAAGIDMVLLVIAADDGVMPQTREHLEICSLLGIRHGLVAVTKADMVDDEWLQATIQDIRGYLKESFLDGAPVIPVSSVTGKGVPELISNIDSLARSIKERKSGEILRLPVDRSFTIKGFGTVATGTLLSGKVMVGDEVELLPGSLAARVRGIQIHGSHVEVGVAGSRVAINLQGIDRDTIRRGDTFTHPGRLTDARTFEAVVSLLPSAPRPLKDGAVLMMHLYSSSAEASVTLLNAKEIRPGDSALTRIRTNEPMVALHGDRFVLRTPDAGTIGGGTILDVNPPRRGRKDAVEELKRLSSGDLKTKALIHIRRGGINGISAEMLSTRFNLSPSVIESAVSDLVSSKSIFRVDGCLISAEAVKALMDRILEVLGSFHKKEPMKAGMPAEEFRTRLKIAQAAMDTAVAGLVKDRFVVMEREILRLASHKTAGGETKGRIEAVYLETGLTPPTLTELTEKLKIKDREAMDLLMLLSKEGRLIKVKDLFFSKESIDALLTKVREFFAKKSDMTPVDFKEMTGLSRKFAIPLLEYLDLQKVTLRVGDVRKLRKG